LIDSLATPILPQSAPFDLTIYLPALSPTPGILWILPQR